jgi:Uma2 family endonuclease
VSALETKLITADELLRMPDDGFRYELVKGALLRMPLNGVEHGAVTMALASPLYQYVKANDLGKVYAAKTGFKLQSDPDTVRAPDIAFVCKRRIQETARLTGFRGGAPDLVVEVMNPDDKKRDVAEKISEYFAGGARFTWVVNPEFKTVAVYRSPLDATTLTEKDSLDGGHVVRGFQIAVAEIFAV